jgi:hypothetical protein
MKKFVIGLLMFMVFAVTVPLSAEAQCRRGKRYNRSSNVSRNYVRTNRRSARTNRRSARTNRRYATRGYTTTRRPSFYRRHRNLINVGIGAGGGALLGGLIGGNRRGIGAGALIGAGAGALYTYVIKPKKRRY